MGDCVGNSNHSSGDTNHRYAALAQSPQKTFNQREGQGVVIFYNGNLKVLLYAQGTRMRMVAYRDGKPTGERLYLRVTDVREIQKIENRSTNWSVKGISEKSGYIISEQRDAYEKPTGFCRLIKWERAIVEKRLLGKICVIPRYSSKDWIYYERRA